MSDKDNRKDSQSRKWQLTINNPTEKGYSHKDIAEKLHTLKALSYYCMADEMGQTFHTHVYVCFSSAVRFSTLKIRFAEAHIEAAHGTNAQNRDYIMKAGKWQDDVKHGTSVAGSFEEWGEIPAESSQGKRSDIVAMYEMIKDGASDIEIIEQHPRAMMYLDKIERVRQTLKAERYSTEFRQMEVTYIWGPTGTGKTRGVMEQYGYDNVCRVTDYDHPFERYNGEDVLLFDEFRSSLRIAEMLNYLDGYPLMLPCRYANRQACYTKVYLISNIPIENQYINIQVDEPATWAAFLRRIHHVLEFTSEGCNAEIPEKHLQSCMPEFTELVEPEEDLPF